jgi:hypothetical protein
LVFLFENLVIEVAQDVDCVSAQTSG